MKNFVQEGNAIELPAPTGGVVAGTGYLVGTFFFGVAESTVAQTLPAIFYTTGVFSLPKTTADVIAVGDKLWWDNTNHITTKTAAGNIPIGIAVSALGAVAGSTNVFLQRSPAAAA